MKLLSMVKKFIVLVIVIVAVFFVSVTALLFTAAYVLAPPPSRVTIANRSPYEMVDVVLRYAREIENIDSMSPGDSFEKELDLYEETGISLRYTVNDKTYESLSDYIEPSGSHVYYVINDNGSLSVSMSHRFIILEPWSSPYPYGPRSEVSIDNSSPHDLLDISIDERTKYFGDVHRLGNLKSRASLIKDFQFNNPTQLLLQYRINGRLIRAPEVQVAPKRQQICVVAYTCDEDGSVGDVHVSYQASQK